MNCPNCDNDLMVRLEPQGAMRFLRFLPVESYYCVKCGKRVTRLSGPSSNPALGVALMVVVLAGMAFAVWRSSGDREATKPAPPEAAAPAPTPAAPPAPAAPAEGKGAVVQVPVAPNPAPAPAASPAAPPAPAAKPAPAAPAPPAAAAAKPAPAPAKPAPAPVKAAPAPVKTAPAAVAKAPATGLRTISAITAAVTGKTTKITVTAGSPLEGFNAFPLAGPARFVLDLPGRFAYRGASSIPVSGGAVTGVRVGAYPDKIRLVLDYSRTGPDGRPAKPPTVVPTPQGMTITAE